MVPGRTAHHRRVSGCLPGSRQWCGPNERGPSSSARAEVCLRPRATAVHSAETESHRLSPPREVRFWRRASPELTRTHKDTLSNREGNARHVVSSRYFPIVPHRVRSETLGPTHEEIRFPPQRGLASAFHALGVNPEVRDDSYTVRFGVDTWLCRRPQRGS